MLWGFEDKSDVSLPPRNSECSGPLLGEKSVHTPGSGVQGRKSGVRAGAVRDEEGSSSLLRGRRGLQRWAWTGRIGTPGGEGEALSQERRQVMDRGERSHTVPFATFTFSFWPLALINSLSFLSREF